MRAILLALVALTVLPGCLTLPADSPTRDLPPVEGGSGAMSARESMEETSGLCTDEVGVGGNGRFCASRTIRVSGTMSGLRALEVNLDSFNGDVAVSDSPEGAWGFVAVLSARADTEAEAKARLETIEFSWAHERAGAHMLEVIARKERDASNLAADISAELPRSLLLRLAASTTNGDVSAKGIRADGLSLRTTNGDAVADAETAQVELATTNGDVEARLRPIESGRARLATTNGEVRLVVPEGARYGYEFEGSTTNGEVEIGLTDGEKGECPRGSEYYTPPCNRREFTTSGFSSREVRTSVTAASTNGDVTVSPS